MIACGLGTGYAACLRASISARDIGTQAGSISCAQTAGDHGTIQVGQFVGKSEQCPLFGQQKLRMTSISLPSISGTFGTRTANHPPAMAIVANATARDVVDDDAVSLFEAPNPRTNALDNATGFVSCNNSSIGFRPCALTLRTINSSEIATTEGRSFHPH